MSGDDRPPPAAGGRTVGASEGDADGPGGGADGARGFDRRMLEALVCPATQSVLEWDAERGELVSRRAGLAYPVRDGIPIMLEAEARRLD